MPQSVSVSLSRNDCSASVSWVRLKSSRYCQSGLPRNISVSHQVLPASSASRSVSDIGGSTALKPLNMGLDAKRRRSGVLLNRISSGAKTTAAIRSPTQPIAPTAASAAK